MLTTEFDRVGNLLLSQKSMDDTFYLHPNYYLLEWPAFGLLTGLSTLKTGIDHSLIISHGELSA